jgi:putative flippase GtrA
MYNTNNKIIQNKLFSKASVLNQFIKYGLVGIANTIVTLGAIFLLMNVLGVSYIISNAVGYILGFVNSFVLNKIWTFKSKGSLIREATFFIAIFAICYVIQLGCLITFKEFMNIRVEFAQIFSMVVYTILNFIGNRYFTFKKV